jgi:excisionase family DNA binding protein
MSDSITLTDDQIEALADRIAQRQAPAPLLDAAAAGALLNVPASWVLAEARAGRMPAVRMGKYVRFRSADLAEWLDRRASR